MIDTRGLTGEEIYKKYFSEGKWRKSEDTRTADDWVTKEFDKLPKNLQNMDGIYNLYRKYFDQKEIDWYASSDEEAEKMKKEAAEKAAAADAENAKKSEIAGYTLDDLKQLGGNYSTIFQGMSSDDVKKYYNGYIKKNIKSMTTDPNIPELELTDAGRQAIWDYLHKAEEEKAAEEAAAKKEEEAAKEEVTNNTKADLTEKPNIETEDTSVNPNNDVTNESVGESEVSSGAETADFTGRETQQAAQQAMADSADAAQTEAYQNYLANATAGINKSRAGMLASQGADPTQNVQSNYSANRQLGTSTQNDYLQKMSQANALQQQADMMKKGQGWNIASGALQGLGAGASFGMSMGFGGK